MNNKFDIFFPKSVPLTILEVTVRTNAALIVEETHRAII